MEKNKGLENFLEDLKLDGFWIVDDLDRGVYHIKKHLGIYERLASIDLNKKEVIIFATPWRSYLSKIYKKYDNKKGKK